MRRRERAEAPVMHDPSRELREAVEGLTQAVDAGGDCLPPDQVRSAHEVLHKASERLELSGAHTVVALAGATGAGKSSLFNALVGDQVSRVGALRPTTSRVSAAVWGDADASALLEWVGAHVRHRVQPADESTPGGLVLLDLPDIDSLETSHRDEADRVLDLADVFVWVTDPQKYADAVLHERYLSRAARHQGVTLVLLNHVDRMSAEEAEVCRADLKRLLAQDGLPDTEVLLMSARTGQGVPELREALTSAAAAAMASRARLLADLQREADALLPHLATSEAALDSPVDDEMLRALSIAAGIPTVLQTVESDYRRQAAGTVGWPFARWVRHLRPDPLKRLRLERAGTPDADVAELLGRSSLPQATPAARAAVELATRKLGARAARGLPGRWARAVEDAATPDGDTLADALDRAILATPLRDRTPWWWRVVGVLQVLLAAAAVVGLVWLIILGGFAFLRMPASDVPTVASLPLPTLLLLGGALGGLVLTALARPMVAVGARRRRARVEQRLTEHVRMVAEAHLLAPVRAVLDRHRRTRQALHFARAG